MHIVVSWDILSSAGLDKAVWNERLKDALKAYAWVRPLETVYIVPIMNEFDRQSIINALTSLSQQASGNIHVIVSPAMAGGQYGGVLPPNIWPELNKRTTV